MKNITTIEQSLIEKIKSLPEDKVEEIVDFVDFLYSKQQNQPSARSMSKLAEPSFQKIWDNPVDAQYDNL
ncbi:hypothetical protein ES703_40051 [subsurface metagenome]